MKYLTSLLVFAAALWVGSSMAQSPLFSTRQDVTGNGGSDYIAGISRTNQGEFLTFGVCDIVPTIVKGICVSRFSGEGEFLVSQTFTDGVSRMHLLRDGLSSWNDSLHVAAVDWNEHATLWCFDASGDTLWVRHPIAAIRNSQAGGTHFSTTGEILFCGTTEADTLETSIFLARYSATGGSIWVQEYPLPLDWLDMMVHIGGLTELSDGGAVITGSRRDQFGDGAQQWMLGVNSTGELLYLNDIEGPGEGDTPHVTPTFNNTFTVAGMRRQENPNQPGDFCCPRPFFARYTNDGILLWNRLFQGTKREFTDFALSTLADGSVLSAGFTTHQYGSNAYLFNVTASGDSSWHREYSAPDTSCMNHAFMPHTILIESPYRIVIGGVVGLCGNDHWLMRTDGSGMPPNSMGLITTLPETDRIIPILSAHPNPSNGELHIHDTQAGYPIALRVHDAVGRLVMQLTVLSADDPLIIEGTGTYFLSMRNTMAVTAHQKLLVY